MSRLLQQILAPFEANSPDAREHALPSISDEDHALGFESANPSLQFEGWDPAATPPGPFAAY